MSYNLPKRVLVSQDDAAMTARPDIPRSRFKGQWTRKSTFDAGELIPFLCDEILPGDNMKYNVQAYVRMATPLFPIFDNQRVDTFFFFIPNRIIMDEWQSFMGEQTNPSSSLFAAIPTTTSPAGGFLPNTIFDHFGLPVAGQIAAGQQITVNVLPLRAYARVYNEWFRDQNLINSIPASTSGASDSYTDYSIQRRAKSHDYFTSALPWPQKFVAPTVSLGGNALVYGIGASGGTLLGPTAFNETATGTARNFNLYYDSATSNMAFERGGVYADLSTGGNVSINTFRQAFLVQQLLERDARGGTRYVELLKAHFDVTSPDFRLQRPEYIGGGSSPLMVTPVAQTAPSVGGVVGSLGAAATATGSHQASYAATEHGYILGLINVRTELSYSQGLHKMWTRSTRYDFYWPSLSGLGEQAVLRQEIYCTGVDADDATVFGYQERWHEYRTRYSEVTGLFRPTTTGNIDEWHLSQQFSAAPVLGQTFIEDSPPMSRVLAAGALAADQQYLADILIERDATRPIPMFGTPVTLGRF